MARKKKAKTARKRRFPVVFKVLALSLIALVALLLLLPEPPRNDGGGVTAVNRHVPALRDTVDPLARVPLPGTVFQNRNTARQIPPRKAPEPSAAPATPAGETLPAPRRKPARERVPEPEAEFVTRSQPRPEREVVSLTPAPALAPRGRSSLPSKSEIRGWVRSQAWEFLGGVDPQGNILYRFEVWLEAPVDVLGAIKQVSYGYDAPSATPASREIGTSEGGFRARFGSLACAQKLTIEVTMADGRSRRAVVDGCKALN